MIFVFVLCFCVLFVYVSSLFRALPHGFVFGCVVCGCCRQYQDCICVVVGTYIHLNEEEQ